MFEIGDHVKATWAGFDHHCDHRFTGSERGVVEGVKYERGDGLVCTVNWSIDGEVVTSFWHSDFLRRISPLEELAEQAE